jgi:uncharacterized protein with GYD domain
MAKYLCIVTYTAEGLKGLTAKGGTARVEASRKFVASAGGTVDNFFSRWAPTTRISSSTCQTT